MKEYDVVKRLSKIKYIYINEKVLTRDVSLPFAEDRVKNVKLLSFNYLLFEDDYDKKDPLNKTKGDLSLQAGNKMLLDIDGIELLLFAKKLLEWLPAQQDNCTDFAYTFKNQESIYFDCSKQKDKYIVRSHIKKDITKEALLNAIAIYIDDLRKEIIDRFDYDFLPSLLPEIEIDV